jgi:hypothetical protein
MPRLSSIAAASRPYNKDIMVRCVGESQEFLSSHSFLLFLDRIYDYDFGSFFRRLVSIGFLPHRPAKHACGAHATLFSTTLHVIRKSAFVCQVLRFPVFSQPRAGNLPTIFNRGFGQNTRPDTKSTNNLLSTLNQIGNPPFLLHHGVRSQA